eukprot:1685026-Rhodomonas_salina.1
MIKSESPLVGIHEPEIKNCRGPYSRLFVVSYPSGFCCCAIRCEACHWQRPGPCGGSRGATSLFHSTIST